MSVRPPMYCPNLTKTERSDTSCAQTRGAIRRCAHEYTASSKASVVPKSAAVARSATLLRKTYARITEMATP